MEYARTHVFRILLAIGLTMAIEKGRFLLMCDAFFFGLSKGPIEDNRNASLKVEPMLKQFKIMRKHVQYRLGGWENGGFPDGLWEEMGIIMDYCVAKEILKKSVDKMLPSARPWIKVRENLPAKQRKQITEHRKYVKDAVVNFFRQHRHSMLTSKLVDTLKRAAESASAGREVTRTELGKWDNILAELKNPRRSDRDLDIRDERIADAHKEIHILRERTADHHAHYLFATAVRDAISNEAVLLENLEFLADKAAKTWFDSMIPETDGVIGESVATDETDNPTPKKTAPSTRETRHNEVTAFGEFARTFGMLLKGYNSIMTEEYARIIGDWDIRYNTSPL